MDDGWMMSGWCLDDVWMAGWMTDGQLLKVVVKHVTNRQTWCHCSRLCVSWNTQQTLIKLKVITGCGSKTEESLEFFFYQHCTKNRCLYSQESLLTHNW